MGIEPTQDPCGPLAGFEDQGRHQAPVTPDKRFPQRNLYSSLTPSGENSSPGPAAALDLQHFTWSANGYVIRIGPPLKSPSLSDYPRCDAEVQDIVSQICAKGREKGCRPISITRQPVGSISRSGIGADFDPEGRLIIAQRFIAG